MVEDVSNDIEGLSSLETSFYQNGYHDGFEHGRAHGIFEGRALGKDKGFEMWEELGYYLGQAKFWTVIVHIDASKKKALANIEQVLSLIDQFPASIDSATEQNNQDIEALMQAVRSKYRVMCASLGIRPRLQQATMSM